jgi:hypothetical protein
MIMDLQARFEPISPGADSGADGDTVRLDPVLQGLWPTGLLLAGIAGAVASL